jgi:hypothetical protein
MGTPSLSKKCVVAGLILALCLFILVSGCTSQTTTESKSAPPPTTALRTIPPDLPSNDDNYNEYDEYDGLDDRKTNNYVESNGLHHL